MRLQTKRAFRAQARASLERAKTELASLYRARLRYAALELRLSIEALTYDRVQAFAEEIPPSEYRTWQPKKLLQVLLEIEPSADTGSTLRIGEEFAPGLAPTVMHTLGTETVFDLRDIKRHYDALGSFLHMPTFKQLEDDGDADFSRLEVRCKQIVSSLEAALASPIYNITLGSFAQIECMGCGKPVRKRISAASGFVEAKCFECGADYRLTRVGDGKVNWEPQQISVSCSTQACGHAFAIWRHKIERGAHWQCPRCEARYRFDLAIFKDESTSAAQHSPQQNSEGAH